VLEGLRYQRPARASATTGIASSSSSATTRRARSSRPAPSPTSRRWQQT